jgi:hypothetical protein
MTARLASFNFGHRGGEIDVGIEVECLAVAI